MIVAPLLLTGCGRNDEAEKQAQEKSRLDQVRVPATPASAPIAVMRPRFEQLEQALDRLQTEHEAQRERMEIARAELAALRALAIPGSTATTPTVSAAAVPLAGGPRTIEAAQTPTPSATSDAPRPFVPEATAEQQASSSQFLRTLALLCFIAFLVIYGYKVWKRRTRSETRPDITTPATESPTTGSDPEGEDRVGTYSYPGAGTASFPDDHDTSSASDGEPARFSSRNPASESSYGSAASGTASASTPSVSPGSTSGSSDGDLESELMGEDANEVLTSDTEAAGSGTNQAIPSDDELGPEDIDGTSVGEIAGNETASRPDTGSMPPASSGLFDDQPGSQTNPPGGQSGGKSSRPQGKHHRRR